MPVREYDEKTCENKGKGPGIWSFNGVLPSDEESLIRHDRLIKLDPILVSVHGEKPNPMDETPLEAIVHIILTQNTTDKNSDRTFANLMNRFANWEDLACADDTDVADAIRLGGLADIKAARIKRVLEIIKETTGAYSLDFVVDMCPDDAMVYLMKMPGVGPKSAACSLLFSSNIPTFPVDTHVHRVSNRLGLVHTSGLEKTQLAMAPVVPAELTYQLHVNLVHHGRFICRARNPKCDKCPLTGECKYFAEATEEKVEG